ncbi:hypothetical protein DYH09_24610 [bacterium CPR1]|nr:hypothetical protein [bacterium CPR1]
MLVSDYARVLRADQGKQTGRNLLQALEQMATEARLAVSFSHPPPGGGPAGQVQFRRFVPQFSALPGTLPSPLPTNWNPQPSGSLMTVLYSLQGNQLMRQATSPSDAETGPLATNVAGLSAEFLPSGSLQIEASYHQNGVVQVLRLETWCPGL